MSSSLNAYEMLVALESPKGIADAVEGAVDELRHLIRHVPEKGRAEVHLKMRNAYDGIDRLRTIKWLS